LIGPARKKARSAVNAGSAGTGRIRAFSSQMDTGPRQENASKQESGASVLIRSAPSPIVRATDRDAAPLCRRRPR
jgi:hypothetical protein